MSPPRAPMRPPDLPGFDHVRLLGSGGYSDVFLYEQRMPRRQVAIKVLLAEDLGQAGRQEFYDEANTMAAVSTHPFIVTILHADISRDGQPFLVMEYYPRHNFNVRCRTEQLSVAEVLRTGIQVASAVETAHMAGILHRDIKPANILTSEYNRPGLTDFGIATAADGSEAQGMSVPWSPPEVVNGSAPGDERSDVYSLAACLYTLLAGRSPFEVAGGSNRGLDLINRIESAEAPPTGRGDMPVSFERVLRHGLSKRAEDRPQSAVKFARMLQSVEVDMGFPVTDIEISTTPEDFEPRNATPDEDGTRLRAPMVINSQSRPVAPTSGLSDSTVQGRTGSQSVVPTELHDGTVMRPGPGTDDRTAMRPVARSAPDLISGVGSKPVGLSGRPAPRPVQPMPSEAFRDEGVQERWQLDSSAVVAAEDEPEQRWVTKALVGLLAIVAIAAIIGLVTKQVASPRTTSTTSTTVSPLPPPLPGAIRSPSQVKVGAPDPDGTRLVTWAHPGQAPEEFTYQVLDVAGSKVIATVEGALSARVDATNECVRVIALNSGGSSDKNAKASFADTCT